jgi:mannosyl-3-phosphoglycerate phosphatase
MKQLSEWACGTHPALFYLWKRKGIGMKIVVLSDLDATLLDREAYSWKPAERAIEALIKRDAALVMVTSKTFSEVKSLHEELSFDDPFVFENGGGIALHKQSALRDDLLLWEPKLDEFQREGFAVLALGTRYEVLVKSLAEISTEVGTPLLGFSAMSDERVAEATGLRPEQAAKARMRLFDEPFMISKESAVLEAQIQAGANRQGLDVVKGGRFWHLIGHAGRGKAVSMLIEAFRKRYGELVTIGLGDSPNDFPFLQLVDIPVVLGKPLETEGVLPLSGRAHRYDVPGPEGWNQAVLDILAKL